MIRFSCRKCGKSLRADESIIGRSSRCTSCSAVNRVPDHSTRQSGERPNQVPVLNVPVTHQEDDLFDDDVVTLIADSDSDSFEGFEDLDLSRLNLKTEFELKSQFSLTPQQSSIKTTPEKGLKSESIPLKATPGNSIPDKSTSIKATPFSARVREPSKRSGFKIAWPTTPLTARAGKILAVIGACLLLVVGYWGYRTFFSGPSQANRTALELSTVGQGYTQVLFEVKKAERVMSFLERAYREKKLPESGLSGLVSVRQDFKSIVDDQTRLEAANEKYEAGDREGAQQLLNEQIELLNKLKTRIDRETGALKSRIYGG